MDTLHTLIASVGLFALTFLIPGANLLVVVQSTLSGGRAAGIASGMGVAAGDGIYAGLGLFGMSALITEGGMLFQGIKILGGLYLIWLGIGLIRSRTSLALSSDPMSTVGTMLGYFTRGLVTDLANPQTVLFFVSIFAMTLTPMTPMWVKGASWIGIVATSLLWRSLLSVALSHDRVRRAYERVQVPMERLAGIALGAFGARLLIEGVGQRGGG